MSVYRDDHRSLVRALRWGLPLLVTLPFVGCSGAPDAGEKSATQSAALDPGNVIPPTTYTITMWAQINNVDEPTAEPGEQWDFAPSPPGTCVTPGPACSDSDCYVWTCWTTDTGYQFWGELAAQVSSHNPGGGTSTQNAVSSSCLLSTPGNLGSQTWDALSGDTNPNSANVTTCSGKGEQNGGANGAFQGGKPLTLAVTVNSPTDTVALASVLDNVEQTPAAGVPASAAPSELAQAGSLLGSGSGYVSQAVKVVFAGAADATAVASGIGTIPAVIADVSAIAGLLWPPAGSGDTPGQHESCVGGVFPLSNGQVTDTLMMSLTGAQLEAAALSGVDLQVHDAGGWARTSDGVPHCSSDITIHMSVSRQWGAGLAAAPRSGDFAIVSAPNQIDTLVVPGAAPSGADTSNQFVRVHGDGTSWSAPQTTDGYPNQLSWDEGSVTTSTVGALAELASPTAQGYDDFFFWAGNTGLLYAAPFNHTWPLQLSGGTIFDQTYTSPGGCKVFDGGRTVCWPAQTGNLLPPNAHVTAVSRTPTNLDAFFIDAFGALWNVYSGDAGKTWGSVRVTSDNTGVAGSPVSAVARTANSLDVFFYGPNGLEHAAWSQSPWSVETVSGTAGLATPGAYVSAVAQSVDDLDVFFVDTSGSLWRAYAAYPSQPTLLATKIGLPGSTQEGASGGPIAAVSRQPGYLDVVFQSANPSNGPTWYSSTSNGQQWATGNVPVGDASGGISILAPSSYELRVLTIDRWHNVATSDWVASGAPRWSSAQELEILDPHLIPIKL